MTSDRPYRSALSVEEATTRLRAGAGHQWDPIVVNALLALLADGRLERDGQPLVASQADEEVAVAAKGPTTADAA
jgi:HD-GYP domain-containing protein (c-di-GMP phosphodiesterase class II)